MKFWRALTYSTPADMVTYAVAAEDAGFYGVTVADHLFVPETVRTRYPYSANGAVPWDLDAPWPDPVSMIAAMAARTNRIRFATNVFILPLRNPIEVARAFATSAVLSEDRVVLGVGAGWLAEEYSASRVDFATRGRRYDEAIDVLQKLWSGAMVEHHGEFFDFPALKLNPAPVQQIPIYVAGPSIRAMRRAAETADGWISGALAPEDVAPTISRLRELRAAAGRADVPFEIITFGGRNLDHLRRLRDLGITGIVDIPPRHEVGPTSTRRDKQESLKRFAQNIIDAF